MNVLDWPAGDVDGQIQHKANTTFADSNNPDIKNPDDEAGSHGDMRLVPMLEVVMTGEPVPLKLTDPAATVIVGSGTALSSTVTPEARRRQGQHALHLHPAAGRQPEGLCGHMSGLGCLCWLPSRRSTDTIAGKRVVELADGNQPSSSRTAANRSAPRSRMWSTAPTPTRWWTCPCWPRTASPRMTRVGRRAPVVAYVPLNVATDDTGGGKSAFQSHMLYWLGGNSAWVEPQQMRIIWLVQMLTDRAPTAPRPGTSTCKDHPDATQEEFDAAFDAYCATNRTVDQIMPVQIYDESWHLTGLTVREDHGLDVAVSYVNPDLPTFDDDPLWTLSWGLGQQFVPQRDCETKDTIWNDTDPNPNDDDPTRALADGKRDLTVFLSAPTTDHSVQTSATRRSSSASISRPPCRPTNAGASPRTRCAWRTSVMVTRTIWAISPRPRRRASWPPTRTTAWCRRSSMPREERYRAAGLDAGTVTGSGALTVDLNTEDYPEETLTGLQWAHYRYNDKTKAWEGYPSNEVLGCAGGGPRGALQSEFPNDTADTIEGRMLTARAYSNGLDIGVAETESLCAEGELVCAVPKDSTASDVMMIKAGFAVAGGLNTVSQKIVGEFFAQRAYILGTARASRDPKGNSSP